MKMSIHGARKLKTRAINYLDNCYIKVIDPHHEANDFLEFVSNRISETEKIMNFINEPVYVEIPPRYIKCISVIIGD